MSPSGPYIKIETQIGTKLSHLSSLNQMGNCLSEQIYIVAEVDYRLIRLDQPLLTNKNLCLRYPTISTTQPHGFTVNYNQPLQILYLNVYNIDEIRSFNGSQLRIEGKTTVVMVKCWRNKLTGWLSDCQIMMFETVPITKSYAMK